MKQEVEKWRPFGHPDGDIRDLSFLDAHQAVYVQHHEGKEPLEYRFWVTYSLHCVFRSIRSRIGIEVRSAIRIHSINRELNFFYRFLTRFFAAFHYRGIFPQ
nr:hypothetical protein [Escherichia coli]